MKTTIYKSLILLLLGTLLISGQDSIAQVRKLSRQEQKEIKKARMEADYYRLDSLLDQKSFVLRADYLRSKDGVNTPVLPNLNFIIVDKTQGVLQTGAASGAGNNGVGGFTAEGTIDNWEKSGSKGNLTYTVRFSILSNLGNFDVLMFVSADGHATATITGLTAGRLTWNGYLTSVKEARIFRGRQSI